MRQSLFSLQKNEITDLIEYMVADGRGVGYVVTEDEQETMGIDDLEALQRAQAYYRQAIEGTP